MNIICYQILKLSLRTCDSLELITGKYIKNRFPITTKVKVKVSLPTV